VHHIYPEGAGNLARAKGKPAHEFFKKFGQAMPKKDWNDPGTKQGVYMIGPNAEYLEGGGAISGNMDAVRKRLRNALDRWNVLRKKQKYANKPVPETTNIVVPAMAGKPLVLRVFLRDLPRGKKDDSGRRFTERDLGGLWIDFTKWAWNLNWLGLDDATVLVPKGKKLEPVKSAVFRRICREALVDNVRGQNRGWRDQQVKLAELTMLRLKDTAGNWNIEYRGKASMESGNAKFAPKLYGRGVWNPKKRQFESLEIVAIGEREGAGRFNQRERDRGPAPMGVALVLYRAEQSTSK
jgi:hypothetical protein